MARDERLAEHYASGDVYLNFAIAAGLAPAGATKKTHKPIRDLAKVLFLATGYGMQAPSLAKRAGITLAEAKELLQLHAGTYRDFTRWREAVVDRATLSGRLSTSFGWRRRGCERAPATELMNWPVQSAASELMQIVCIAATESRLELACPVHDGFLITGPLERLDRDVDRMKAIMVRASEIVTGDLAIKVEADVVRYPDRYMDERGEAMWNRVMGLLAKRGKAAA